MGSWKIAFPFAPLIDVLSENNSFYSPSSSRRMHQSPKQCDVKHTRSQEAENFPFGSIRKTSTYKNVTINLKTDILVLLGFWKHSEQSDFAQDSGTLVYFFGKGKLKTLLISFIRFVKSP